MARRDRGPACPAGPCPSHPGGPTRRDRSSPGGQRRTRDPDGRARRVGARDDRLERGCHRNPAGEPARRVRIERPDDERVEGGGDLGADRARRRRVGTDPDRRQGRRRLARPCPLPGQRLVQDQAEAVDVGGAGRRLALRLLRTEVVDRAEGRARDRALGVGRQPGDPEVGDHRPAVAREQDVARLDVAMDDPADVRHAQRASDVEPDPGRLRRTQPTQPPESGRQVLTLDELHDQERLAVVGAGLETGHDVRVAQHRGGQRLAAEAHRDIGIGDDLATEQLDRHGAVELGVGGAMDRRHPADPDDLGEPIPLADQPALVRRGRRGLAWVGHAPKIAEVPEIGPRPARGRPSGGCLARRRRP